MRTRIATYARAELDRLLEEAKAKVAKLTSSEIEEMIRQQRESWVRGELLWPKPRYKMVNGVKVYESYSDYCND